MREPFCVWCKCYERDHRKTDSACPGGHGAYLMSSFKVCRHPRYTAGVGINKVHKTFCAVCGQEGENATPN